MPNDTDFTIASGRKLRLLGIDQYRTYEGLLLGVPTWGSNPSAPDPCLNVNLPNPAARVHWHQRNHPGDKRPWDSSARIAGVVATSQACASPRPPMLLTHVSTREKLRRSALAARRYTLQLT